MAWMSYQQAKNGPLTLFSDVIYASVASKGSFVTSKTFSPHVSGTIGATLAADYKYWIVEAGGHLRGRELELARGPLCDP